MNRDYARLVKVGDSTKTLRFLFDVGCIEEKPADFNYDSITDYVANEFIPNATNFVVQNVAQKYEKARRVCEENGIDCSFPAYEETPLEKDVLVYPCEAGRFAYLLATVVGPLQDAWYNFRFKMQAGPFGSSTENGVVAMQPSFSEDGHADNIKLRPIRAVKIPNGKNSPFGSEIWTALFVDWRYAAWDFVYQKEQIPADLETRRAFCYLPDVYSVLHNVGQFAPVDFSLSRTQSFLLSLPNSVRIKNLENAPLPLAIDHALACYGFRLYGGKAQLPDESNVFFNGASFNLDVGDFPADVQSKLKLFATQLAMRPTETRVYFRNDKYGAFADSPAGLSNTTNKTSYGSLKEALGWKFHIEKAIEADPIESNLLYVTNFHESASPNAWRYKTFRIKETSTNVYSGYVVDGDLQSSYNGAEVSSIKELNQTVEHNGTPYFTEAQPSNAPINAGGIFDDVTRNRTRGGMFSAENLEQFGIKQATVDAIEGGYVYVSSDKKYRCQAPGDIEDLNLQVGDSILIGCNPKAGTIYPIANKAGEEYEGGTRIEIDEKTINWLGLTTTENSVDGTQTTGVLNLSGSKRTQITSPQESWAQVKWTGVTVGVDQGWVSSYKREDEVPQRPHFDDVTEVQFDSDKFETVRLKNNDDGSGGSVVLVKLKSQNKNSGTSETPFGGDAFVWFDNAASCVHRKYADEDELEDDEKQEEDDEEEDDDEEDDDEEEEETEQE